MTSRWGRLGPPRPRPTYLVWRCSCRSKASVSNPSTACTDGSASPAPCHVTPAPARVHLLHPKEYLQLGNPQLKDYLPGHTCCWSPFPWPSGGIGIGSARSSPAWRSLHQRSVWPGRSCWQSSAWKDRPGPRDPRGARECCSSNAVGTDAGAVLIYQRVLDPAVGEATMGGRWHQHDSGQVCLIWIKSSR